MTTERNRGWQWLLQGYGLAVALVVASVLRPAAVLVCWLRRRGCRSLLQRLGDPRADPPRDPPLDPPVAPDLLIHAVSTGEMVLAGVLIGQLRANIPGLRVLLTTGNAGGAALGRRLQGELPEVTDVLYLPWDRPRAIQAWLARLAPKAVVVVETELWPGLFTSCRRLGIPLLLVNARIYPGDLWRYRAIRGLMQPVLACATWIGVPDAVERQNFSALGVNPARIAVMGNLKARPPARLAELADLAPWPRLIVAGSTHAPEERWLLAALGDLVGGFPGTRLVLAPRHPARVARLRREVLRRGWRCRLFSSGTWMQDDWDVLLVDRFGVLLDLYARAAIVVMGGTFATRGGHNFLEPAWLGRPILVGPGLAHFRGLAQPFLAAGALCRADSPRDMLPCLRDLLGAPAAAEQLGRLAQACARREAARQCVYGSIVARLLAEHPAKSEAVV